ncbi:TRAP transporter small permease [Oceanispirochaeta crateris]|uniref:TRAP transporter small permease n=1 Tax=Oceanispirochaeta crateris TaxID=2518645 RepID=A0A5C1QLF3_9SPIO|nr:TRAP transporter small permease [Oceanispirochaeta crateris]QEN08158.1 TRAP transporter small permease [Oceanispirochaeta crateris]
MFNTLTSIISNLANVLEKIVKYIAMTVVIILLCTIFFQVARRVITGKSYTEIEEFSIVMAAWLGFFAIAYATRKKVHVRIDVFSKKLSFFSQKVLSIVINAVTLYASIDLVGFGWKLMLKKAQIPLAILPTNAGWWYLAFPLGMACTSFFLLDQFLQEIQNFKEPKSKIEDRGQA